jgi:hypothetical protein
VEPQTEFRLYVAVLLAVMATDLAIIAWIVRLFFKG